MERIRVHDIIGKTIVGESGRKLGIVANIDFIVESGELLNIVVESPTKYLKEFNLKTNEKGKYLIPFSAVKSIGDFVIVSEDELL